MLEMLRPYRISTMIPLPMIQHIDFPPCMMDLLMDCAVLKKCVMTNVRSGYQGPIDGHSNSKKGLFSNIDALFERVLYLKKGQMGSDGMLFRSLWATLHLDCRK